MLIDGMNLNAVEYKLYTKSSTKQLAITLYKKRIGVLVTSTTNTTTPTPPVITQPSTPEKVTTLVKATTSPVTGVSPIETAMNKKTPVPNTLTIQEPLSPKEFEKLPVAEQDKVIFDTYGTDKTTQVYRAYTGNIGLIPHPKLSNQAERIKQYFNSRGVYRDNLTEKEIRSALRYLLYEDVVDPVGAQERVLAKMSPTQRTIETAGKSFVQMGAGIANFPEFIVEEGGGRVYNAIVSGGKELNKPITPPSWSPRGYYEKEIAPSIAGPSGAVGTVFSAGTREFEKRTGAWTPEKEAQFQSGLKIAQKYPETFIGGTFGELLGAKATTTSITLGKNLAGRGAVSLVKKTTGKEIIPKALTPTNIATEAVSRTRQKLGLEKEIKSEKYFTPETSTYGQITVPKGIKEFEKTKTTGLRPGEYTVSHTAPSPLVIMPRTVKIKGSTSESPALSTSPFGRAVPQFLKVGEDIPESYRISPIPKISKPTSPTIFLKDIYRLPKEVRTDFAKSAELMKTQPKGKYGIVAPKMEMGRGGKAEPEVLIWKGTKLTRTKEFTLPKDIIVERKVWKDLSRGKQPRLSTTYKGVRVPIPVYELKGEGKPGFGFTKIGDKIKIGFRKVVFESEKGKTEPYFRPTYFKPSYPLKPYRRYKQTPPSKIYDYSRPSKPSYPFKPSEPYKPSENYKPSEPYKPSENYKYSEPSKPSYQSKYSKPSYPSYPKSSYPSRSSYPSIPSYPSKSSKSSKPVYYIPSSGKEQTKTKFKKGVGLKKGYRQRAFKLGTVFGGKL